MASSSIVNDAGVGGQVDHLLLSYYKYPKFSGLVASYALVIWKYPVPPKVKFCWVAIKGRLNTVDSLEKKHVHKDPTCLLFGQDNERGPQRFLTVYLS